MRQPFTWCRRGTGRAVWAWECQSKVGIRLPGPRRRPEPPVLPPSGQLCVALLATLRPRVQHSTHRLECRVPPRRRMGRMWWVRMRRGHCKKRPSVSRRSALRSEDTRNSTIRIMCLLIELSGATAICRLLLRASAHQAHCARSSASKGIHARLRIVLADCHTRGQSINGGLSSFCARLCLCATPIANLNRPATGL